MFFGIRNSRLAQRGYTLIDLAIAMVIFGLLLSGIAAGARIYMKDKEITETRERAQVLARAIDNFVLENARFPCPAGIDLSMDNTKYGAETSCSTRQGFDAAGSLSTAVVAGNFGGGLYIEESEKSPTKYVARGMIPFAALNIPEFYAYDGYGNRFQYAVTVDQTVRDTFLDSGGGITVMDSRETSDTDQTKSNHFLVFSAGASEEGAWSRYGAQVKPCGSGLDAENCNTAAAGTAKQALYVSARYSTADGSNRFDDIMLNKASMHLPLWRTQDSTGADIRTIDDGKRVVIQEVGKTVDADPSSAAAEMRMDVAGAARVERSISQNYCLHTDGSACFDTALLLDNARGELNCSDATVAGRDSQGNYMYGIERSLANCRTGMTWLCPPGEYARGILANGLPDCQLYNFTPEDPPGLVIGNCGTANYTARATAPSTAAELCSAGTASVVAGAGPWTWSCTGENGGLDVDCEAYKEMPPVNGLCGASDGTTVASAPSNNLCSTGTATAVTGAGPWAWTCEGTDGGSTDSCSANKTLDPVNGACGASHNSNVMTAPSSDLCVMGTPSSVSGSGPWTWNCAGEYGGTTANCTAYKPIVGVCGSSHGANMASAPGSNLCATGTATAVGGTGPWTWSCTGQYGGASASCSANKTENGSCGSANGVVVASAPASNLCSVGSASAVGGSNPYSWTCVGVNGGTTASCASGTPTTVNGACGASNGSSFVSAPASNLCNTGTATAVSGSGPWTWNCTGGGTPVGTTASCSANQTVTTVNGSCGTANGSASYNAPASNLCNTGTATAVSGSGPWSWNCTGGGTPLGTTSSCSSTRIQDGACGAADGGTYNTAPGGSDLCAVGTASAVAGGGFGGWSWTCSGVNGGGSSNCSAGYEMNGGCMQCDPPWYPISGGGCRRAGWPDRHCQ